ncbi:hypothetical protein [Paenibacillus polymyxa]|uniref:hypothetical protein n=1 Tax=Paenibacillus polymyxa TaxID=1406 RepID=UPI003D26F230
MNTWLSNEVFINKELVNEVKNHFINSKISESYIAQIFDYFSEEQLEKRKEPSNFRLVIKKLEEGKADVTLSSANKGKIFEVTGTNQRFKTTSLILIALILGFDFNEAIDMISSNQILTKVGQLVSKLFSANDTIISLEISNSESLFSFTKNPTEIIIIYNGKKQVITLNENEYNSAYKIYKEYVGSLNIADPQFISKGRNFVGNVHKEIREEFLATLSLIENKLSDVVTKALDSSNEKNKIRSGAEASSHLVYVNKAINFLDKIDIPIEIIYFLKQQVNSKLYNHFTVTSVKEVASQNRNEILKLKKKYEEVERSKELKLKSIQQILDLFNNASATLPMKFSLSNIKQQLSLFNSEWAELNIDTDISKYNRIPADLEEGKTIPFNVSSRFFSNISVNSINSYREFINNISSIHTQLQDLKYKIDSYEENLFSSINELEEIKQQQYLIDKEISEITSDLIDLEKIIRFLEYVDDFSDNDQLKGIFEKFQKNEQSIFFQHLEKCLNKIDLNYTNETKKSLFEKITSYKKELEGAIKIGENVLLFPKKFQDTKEMSKILQDLRAVYNYLAIEDVKEGKEKVSVIQASRQTLLHDAVIILFNQYMALRCKYYFEVNESSEIKKLPLINYNYETMEFDIGNRKVSTKEGISGGTDSAMTVVSFASKKSLKEFGVILLVDEWGDVGSVLADKTYETMEEVNSLGLGIFVKVNHLKDNIDMKAIR